MKRDKPWCRTTNQNPLLLGLVQHNSNHPFWSATMHRRQSDAMRVVIEKCQDEDGGLSSPRLVQEYRHKLAAARLATGGAMSVQPCNAFLLSLDKKLTTRKAQKFQKSTKKCVCGPESPRAHRNLPLESDRRLSPQTSVRGVVITHGRR